MSSSLSISRPTPSLLARVESVVRPWWPVALPLALFGALWLDLIRQLSFEWSNREQYAYGWFVPLLALGLLAKKWASRPSPGLPDYKITGRQANGPWAVVSSPVVRGLWSAVLLLALAALLPLRVVHEINPDWPLISWLLAGSVVLLTLYLIYLAGGWPWVKHFAFPVGFILVAVTWPYRIEHGLTQSLMSAVTALTVIVLGWVDILASQHGNVIEISTGVVGIDEACSGIRSFQSMIMGALFLGELYRLRWPHRLALIGSGVVVAFCLNVVRTLILTWRASDVGIDLVAKWHDPAGLSIFLASFACLWLIAWRIRIKTADSLKSNVQSLKSDGQSAASPFQVSGLTSQPSASTLQVSGFIPQPSAVARTPWSVLSGLPTWLSLSFAAWVAFVLIGNKAWYRIHDGQHTDFIRWSATLPEAKPTFAKVELPPRTLKLLKYDLGFGGNWQEADGSDWSIYFFRWEGKSMQSIMNARYHRPEVCLPAAGLQQVTAPQIDRVDIGPLKLPFEKSTYSAQGRALYVFYCLWQDGDERRKSIRSSGPVDRLLGPLEGSRRFGQQTVEIVVSGCSSMAVAERAVRQRLPELIQIEALAGTPTSSNDNRVSAIAEERNHPAEISSGLRLSK